MAKYMEDGEQRTMQPGSYLGAERKSVEVIAERVDCDTPYVILRIPAGTRYEVVGKERKVVSYPTEAREVCMSDALAEDVAKRILRALSILPTSK